MLRSLTDIKEDFLGSEIRSWDLSKRVDKIWGLIVPVYMTSSSEMRQLTQQHSMLLNCAREELVRAKISGHYGDW